ncbi:MarR family winged helix-turn-helix transcriptional regulator [Agrococcus sp. 1P02AA]|uniref:MarR family winged helix-turn-helix transcriptional regulator n=1 Tax=Agrococcus sp. 1P02AA TaxID=3132259 RepID=UPI0039A6B653
MSAERQAPDPSIAEIAAALDRIGMRRAPGRGQRSGAAPAGEPGPRGAADGVGQHEDTDPGAAGGGPAGHGSAGPGPGGHGGRRGHAAPGGPRGPRGAMGARRMLHAVVHAEQPSSITDLGHAIGVDQPRASRLVQALADAGLVRRIPDPADGRRTVIEATTAGRARFEAHAEARAAEVAAAAASLTSAERAELSRLLAKLALAWPG